jgi:uncharacterized protein YbjT (DUF2867 family)
VAYKAIIAGASGLIGGELLDILLAHPQYSAVLILVRKELPINHAKLTQLVVDFDRLDDYATLLTGNAVFCCLGSTRKKTPDLNIYRKIDHDYPVQLAQIAVSNGINQYHLVSSIGANSASKVFYTKMKGETEDDIKKAGLHCLNIYQPSVLEGKRTESRRQEERIVVALMKFINPLLIGSLKKYRSISATTVAMAMYKQSIKTEAGVFTWTSDKIKQLA